MMKYRMDFLMMMFFTLVMQACNLFVITTIYENIDFISGWDYWEVLVLYSFLLFSEGFINLFMEGVWKTSNLINSGEIDQFMVRPLPVPLQLITCRTELDGINKMGIAILLMGISFCKKGIAFSLGEVIITVFLLLCSGVIRGTIVWSASCLSFWTKSSKNSVNFMAFSLGEAVRYPITIYPFFMKTLFGYLIPYAFVSYYPAAYMLGKIQGFHVVIGIFLVTVLSLFIAKVVYKAGVKRYESPGA